MNRNVILLVDGDTDTCAATLTAADRLKFDVRFARIARDLSELTQFGFDDVSVIVLDYDPDVHGLAIAETLREWSPPRPLVFISSDETSHHHLMLAGKMTKHLIKPVSPTRLAHAIGQLTEHHPECACPSCDRWGHPSDERANVHRARARHEVVA
jgi:CheY-like chemotaxis protein